MHGRRPFDKAWLRRMAPLFLVVLGLLVVRVYVMQVVELVRLRAWRNELMRENAEIERHVADLAFELDRRGTDAWVVEQLHAMGLVGPDEIRVRLVPMTVAAAPTPTPPSVPRVSQASQSTVPFRNETWEAWKALLFGERPSQPNGLASSPER